MYKEWKSSGITVKCIGMWKEWENTYWWLVSNKLKKWKLVNQLN